MRHSQVGWGWGVGYDGPAGEGGAEEGVAAHPLARLLRVERRLALHRVALPLSRFPLTATCIISPLPSPSDQ